MKRTYKNGIVSVAILSMFMGIPKITMAYSSSDKEKYKDSNCDLRYRKDPVQEDKKWKIKFDKELDSDTVNNNNIMIKDEDDREIGADVTLDKDDEDKKTVFIKPYNRCKQGKKYYIIITEKVKSKKGKIVRKPVKMYFNIRNAFAGLPCEDGLIIVKNIAYSVDYLATNSKLKNEILNKPYKVYYCYGVTEQKIKNIFENIDLNKDDIEKHYDKITYVRPNGEKKIYEWNNEEMQYELPKATVETEITVNSSAKVMMVKVKNVKGIEDAFYYRLGHSIDIKKIGETSVFASKNLREPIYIYNYNKNLIGVGILNTHFANESKTKLKIIDDSYKGNVIGNINNNGYAAEDKEGCVFYNNTGDGNKLYKFDINGVFNNTISNDNPQYINVVDDWVFYSNYSDKGKLYRVKKDGTGRRKVCDDMASYVNVCRDWIYYCNHSDGGRIYKIKPDGSSRRKLNSAVGYESAYLNVFGNWIYFTNVDDKHRPYVIDTEGRYITKLTDEWADSMQVVGDWIYYTSNSGVLSKVKKDGSGQIVPIKGQARQFDKGFHLNVFENWIFYSNYLDGGKLYKIRTDGSGENKKLVNDTVDYINIAGDFIYYTSRGRLFRVPVDTDGTIKPEQITRNNGQHRVVQMNDLTITVSFADVNMKIENIENKYLPKKVAGIMDDNTMHQFPVEWDRKNVSIRNGVRVYTGDVIGYNRKVKLNLIIPSEMLNESNTITIYNNAEKNSGVIDIQNEYDNNLVSNPPKLNVGDIVSVYDDKDCKRILGKTIVIRDGRYNRAKIERVNLDRYGSKSIWIAVTRKGKVESKPTEVKYGDAPSIIKVEDRDDPKNFDFYKGGLGLGVDGRDFSIREWIPSQVMGESKYDVYLLQNNGRLDISKNNFKSLDSISEGYSTWHGDSSLKTDSANRSFKDGKYSMFLVGRFTGKASEDNRGRKPVVKGYSSSDPKIIDVEEEHIPKQIALKSRGSVQGGKDITLSKAPEIGERVWLIPINGKHKIDKRIMNKIENWLSQNGSLDESELNKVGTCLVGDGVKTVFKAPYGMKADNPNYQDIEYKVVVINKVGSSGFSKERITVDNKEPSLFNEFDKKLIIPEEKNQDSIKPEGSFKVKVKDEGCNTNTINDPINVYIVPTGVEDSNREYLDAAVRQRVGKVFTISKGVPHPCSVRGLEAITRYEYERHYRNLGPHGINLTNYKVIAVDIAGNMSKQIYFNIIVETERLTLLIDKAEQYMYLLNEDQHKTLDSVMQSAKDVLSQATTKTQGQVDSIAQKLENCMESVGIPGLSSNHKQIAKAVSKGLYLKDINGDYVKQGSNITYDLKLSTESVVDKNVKIKWISSNPSVIKYDGQITRPLKNTSVRLTAIVMYGSDIATKFTKDLNVTVQGIDIKTRINGVSYKQGKILVEFSKALEENFVDSYRVIVSDKTINNPSASMGVRVGTSNKDINLKCEILNTISGSFVPQTMYYVYVVSVAKNGMGTIVSDYKTIVLPK